MKVHFWVIGKTNEQYLKEGIEIYCKRLARYIPFNYNIIPDIRNAGKLSVTALKAKEAEQVLGLLKGDDYLIILDERGKSYDSVAFAKSIEGWLQLSKKRMVFLVGGAYGFDEKLYQRADQKLSFSKMTFSHQMIRLFFVEQLYRAMTILRNEPYHNQ